MNRPVRVKKDSGSAQCWILSGYRVRIVPELSIYPQYLRMKKQSALTYWTIPSHKMPLFCCLKSWAVRAETDLVPLSKRPPCWKCDKRDRANDYTSLIAARHASSKNRLNVGYFPFSKRPPKYPISDICSTDFFFFSDTFQDVVTKFLFLSRSVLQFFSSYRNTRLRII